MHGLGLMWIATPSSRRTCTDYSLTGLPAHCAILWTLPVDFDGLSHCPGENCRRLRSIVSGVAQRGSKVRLLRANLLERSFARRATVDVHSISAACIRYR